MRHLGGLRGRIVDLAGARRFAAGVDDSARFRPDDPDELVVASFACPRCLHKPTDARLSTHYNEPSVSCACLPCAEGWEVSLSGLQFLRLTLAPPRGLALEDSASPPL